MQAFHLIKAIARQWGRGMRDEGPGLCLAGRAAFCASATPCSPSYPFWVSRIHRHSVNPPVPGYMSSWEQDGTGSRQGGFGGAGYVPPHLRGAGEPGSSGEACRFTIVRRPPAWEGLHDGACLLPPLSLQCLVRRPLLPLVSTQVGAHAPRACIQVAGLQPGAPWALPIACRS